jgi:hypothetical protein
VEEVLRAHREQALKVLEENTAQSREGIELLARKHLGALIAASGNPGGTLPPEQLEALYQEVLDLSFTMFSLGYSLALALSREPVSKR